jgi:hypothetical protein
MQGESMFNQRHGFGRSQHDSDLDEIKREVENNGKYLKWFDVDIKTADGTLVAIVKKQIYVRKK